MDLSSYDSFESELQNLQWSVSQGEAVDLLVVGDSVPNELRPSAAFGVFLLAAVEQYQLLVRKELLAKVSQSASFKFAKMCAEHEASKALLFAALTNGEKLDAASVRRSAAELAGSVARLLVDSELSNLPTPSDAGYYQTGILKLVKWLNAHNDTVSCAIISDALGVS